MNNDSNLEKELLRKIEKESRRGFFLTLLTPGYMYNLAVLIDRAYSSEERRRNKERAPEVKRKMLVCYTKAIFIESLRLAAYGYLATKIYESLSK